MAIAFDLRTQLEDGLRKLLVRAHLDVAAAEHSRWLILGAAVLVWLALSIYLTVHVTAAHRHHRELQAEVARLNRLVGDTTWKARLQQSEALKFQLNERLWSAPTPGLAEAAFDRWIKDHVARQGLDAPQVQITQTDAAIQTAGGSRALPGLRRMTAKVTTSFSPSGLAALTADMIESDKVILLDQLIVRSQLNARMEMNVSTFVRLE